MEKPQVRVIKASFVNLPANKIFILQKYLFGSMGHFYIWRVSL